MKGDAKIIPISHYKEIVKNLSEVQKEVLRKKITKKYKL